MNVDMPSISAAEFGDIKRAYIDDSVVGDALKQQLKVHNKVQNERKKKIHTYMRDNNIMSEDIGGHTFEREEKTSVKVNMKTLEEIIDNPADLEQYKREHSTTTESLKIRKPKRQRTEE